MSFALCVCLWTSAMPLQERVAEPVATVQEERAWQAEIYRAPDLFAYFPDDKAGGLALDTWWDGKGPELTTVAEEVAIIRNGIRNTTQHRMPILRWLGNRHVWGKQPQHPDVIELMYHAADFRPEARELRLMHPAVYFGLSVVEGKTPNILRALVELCVEVDDPNDLGRVAWGAADQREALLQHLEPWLRHEDPAVRAKAEDVGRIFREEIGAFAWSRQKAKEKAEAEYRDSLPIVREALLHGDSKARREALDRIGRESLVLIMDDSYLPAFAACAEDADATVRRDVVRTVGGHWVWRGEQQHEDAIALMLKMSHDEAHQVKYDAVYYGLSTVRASREDVVRRLLDMAMFESVMDMESRISWGLHGKEALVASTLLEDLKSEDRDRVLAAYRLYEDLVGEPSPIVPEGMPVKESILGDWVLDLEFPQRKARMDVQLSIALDPKGRAIGKVMEQEFSDGQVVANEFGVFFAVSHEGEGGIGHMSATLKDGALTGTIWLPEEMYLLVFEGRRP